MSFIILEIPHRLPPIAWFAWGEKKIIEAAYNEINETGMSHEGPLDLETAKEILFHDLSAGFVLTEEEARRFVSDKNDVYQGHQDVQAQTAVENVLSDYFESCLDDLLSVFRPESH